MVKTSEGNIWRNLNLAGEAIKYTPLAIVEETLQDADSEGKPLVKKQLQPSVYKYYKTSGEVYEGQIFKLYKGELVGKTSATKEVSKEEVSQIEVKTAYDLIIDHEYLCNVSPAFRDNLKETNKAFKFPFASGYGYKPATAILFFDALTSSILMRVGRSKRSLIIDKIQTSQLAKQQTKEELDKLKGQKKLATIKSESEV